jgi:hypothetical protein
MFGEMGAKETIQNHHAGIGEQNIIKNRSFDQTIRSKRGLIQKLTIPQPI